MRGKEGETEKRGGEGRQRRFNEVRARVSVRVGVRVKYYIRGQGQGLGSSYSYPDWVGSGLVVVKVG